jgi:hypothetical protein
MVISWIWTTKAAARMIFLKRIFRTFAPNISKNLRPYSKQIQTIKQRPWAFYEKPVGLKISGHIHKNQNFIVLLRISRDLNYALIRACEMEVWNLTNSLLIAFLRNSKHMKVYIHNNLNISLQMVSQGRQVKATDTDRIGLFFAEFWASVISMFDGIHTCPWCWP